MCNLSFTPGPNGQQQKPHLQPLISDNFSATRLYGISSPVHHSMGTESAVKRIKLSHHSSSDSSTSLKRKRMDRGVTVIIQGEALTSPYSGSNMDLSSPPFCDTRPIHQVHHLNAPQNTPCNNIIDTHNNNYNNTGIFSNDTSLVLCPSRVLFSTTTRDESEYWSLHDNKRPRCSTSYSSINPSTSSGIVLMDCRQQANTTAAINTTSSFNSDFFTNSHSRSSAAVDEDSDAGAMFRSPFVQQLLDEPVRFSSPEPLIVSQRILM